MYVPACPRFAHLEERFVMACASTPALSRWLHAPQVDWMAFNARYPVDTMSFFAFLRFILQSDERQAKGTHRRAGVDAL